MLCATDYSLGWLPAVARAAALAPGLADAATHAPLVGGMVKRLGGIDRGETCPA